MPLIDVVRRWGIGILGVALLVVGIILLVRGYTAPSGFYVYAPLSNTKYTPPQQGITTGWVLTGVGVVVTVGWGIFTLRSRRRPPASPGDGVVPDSGAN